MLHYRLTLGPVMIAILVFGLWLDEWLDRQPKPDALDWMPTAGESLPPGLIVLLTTVLLVPFAARELRAIFKAGGIRASALALTISGWVGLLVSTLIPTTANAVHSVAVVGTAGAGVLVVAVLRHTRRKELQGATAAAGAALFAFVYLGLMLGFMLAIRRESSAWVLLGVLVVTKSCDIGAFFTGRAIGRHKLIPWVSPGKTWEGLIGGMLFAGLVGAIVVLVVDRLGPTPPARPPLEAAWWQGAIAGAVFGLVGQAGDLLASILKRDAGIKDSGRSIPGFGGVLDVMDSVLLVGPIAYWMLKAV